MISMHGVCKSYPAKRGMRRILNGVSYDFRPGVNVGILGRNGAGKSTMLRLIGGSEAPDSGRITRTSKISWPLGFGGGFNMKISGRLNLRFICRLYNEDYKKICAFVEDFSELGDYMDMPVATYSSGMRAKLTFGISMALHFDYYLIDELTGVGDSVFKKKSKAYFDERRKSATLLVVSHNMSTIKSYCDKMLVLHEGSLLEFGSNDEAERFYNEVCCGIQQSQKQ